MLPARPKKDDRALGRSRGGLSTKIHALVDGLGMLARFHLTGGQAGGSPEALPRLGELKPASPAADKADDSNAILQHMESTGIQAVIPSRANRLEQRPLDEHLHASRNLIERFFFRIKQFRRVVTRYDK
ncbi:IS5 family transposase [Paraburkholderia phytofirmans]